MAMFNNIIESMPIDLPLLNRYVYEIIGTHSGKKTGLLAGGQQEAGKSFNFLLFYLNIQEN